VLASLGLKVLLDGKVRTRALIGGGAVFAGLLSAVATGVYMTYPALQSMWQLKGGASGYHLPAAADNPAIFLPVTLGIVVLIAVFTIARSWVRSGCVLLFIAVVLDLGSFAYYGSGRTRPHDLNQIRMDSTWQVVKDDLRAHHGRFLPLANDGSVYGPGSQIINMINGIPSAGGYGPLMQESYAKVSGMTPSGYLAQPVENSPLFKMLDVLWVGRSAHPETPLSVQMGRNCSPSANPESRRIHLPAAVKVTSLHIISTLGCSTGIAQDEKVLEIRLSGVAGQSEDIPLLAGRDTSEWAIDRADVRQVTLHQRATIFSSFEAGGFSGHSYQTTLLVSPQPVDVQDIEFDWLPKTGSISMLQIALVNDKTGSSYTVPATLDYPAGEDWDRPIRTSGEDNLQRYRKSLGIAWLVDETLLTARSDIAEAAATGHLPDQSVFDPARTALIEDPAALVHAQPSSKVDGHADVLKATSGYLDFDVFSPKAGFLVVSQLFYPGWRAQVNGHREILYRTNGAFQGVVVPAGHSHVELAFWPRSFLYGAGITVLAALLGLYLVCWRLWNRLRWSGERAM